MNKSIKSIISFVFILCFLLQAGCSLNKKPDNIEEKPAFSWVKTASQSNTMSMRELKEGLFGRYFYSGDSAVFCWPANGVEFGFTGTSLKIEFGNSNSGAAVYVDDEEEKYFRVREGTTVTAAEGLDPEEIHYVRIQKRSEPNKGNLVVKSVSIDENREFFLKKYEKERLKIEVIGDSISCGYGNLYGKIEGDHIDTEDGTETFATMLAEYYDAELSVCAISGIGIGREEGYPLPVMPEYIKDGDNPHDFTKNVPDIVIIQLGTNDDSCGNNGESFKKGAEELINFVRSNYPEAVIIWYYGIMGDGLASEIERVIESFREEGDKRIYYLQTYPREDEPIGEKGHPSLETHVRMKEELARFIEEKDIAFLKN